MAKSSEKAGGVVRKPKSCKNELGILKDGQTKEALKELGMENCPECGRNYYCEPRCAPMQDSCGHFKCKGCFVDMCIATGQTDFCQQCQPPTESSDNDDDDDDDDEDENDDDDDDEDRQGKDLPVEKPPPTPEPQQQKQTRKRKAAKPGNVPEGPTKVVRNKQGVVGEKLVRMGKESQTTAAEKSGVKPGRQPISNHNGGMNFGQEGREICEISGRKTKGAAKAFIATHHVELEENSATGDDEDDMDNSRGTTTDPLNSSESSASPAPEKDGSGSRKVKRPRNPLKIPEYISISVSEKDPNLTCYKCNACNKKFKTKAHIKYHEFCHEGSADKPYKCTDCGKTFVAKSHYHYHLRTHTGERPYPCPKCGKRFNQQGKVTRHMRSHTGEKPFVCNQCGRGFANAQALRSHFLIHTGERPFHCTYCTKSFTGMTNLKKHIITHTGERPFSCTVCNKSFGLKWTLDLHLRTHSDDRPFACDQCSRAFSNSKDLRRHLVIHSGERPFRCWVCGTAFRRKDNLERHIRNTHQVAPTLPPNFSWEAEGARVINPKEQELSPNSKPKTSRTVAKKKAESILIIKTVRSSATPSTSENVKKPELGKKPGVSSDRLTMGKDKAPAKLGESIRSCILAAVLGSSEPEIQPLGARIVETLAEGKANATMNSGVLSSEAVAEGGTAAEPMDRTAEPEPASIISDKNTQGRNGQDSTVWGLHHFLPIDFITAGSEAEITEKIEDLIKVEVDM